MGWRCPVYCPQCLVEYRDGFAECADCQVPLLPGPPPPEPPDAFDPTLELVVALETNDGIQLALAKGLLEDAGIPFFVLGQITTLVQDVDPYLRKWLKLQVPLDREAEARELLAPLLQPSSLPLDVPDDPAAEAPAGASVQPGGNTDLATGAANMDLLLDLARHQAWADAAHWKALRENSTLVEDAEIRMRLNHMLVALRRLTALALGETPDPAGMKEVESAGDLEAAMGKADAELIEALQAVDLRKSIALPRGPQGPWEAPAGALLAQAVTHSQHHRGQNAARMRQLGATPPTTDFLVWCALGRP